MGINYYGKCTGSSGGKYDIWMNVSQNSQNIAANTSNITVKVYLKRNDGYAASAYNLNESSNSVIITVAGVEKVNKNIEIDTRNEVTVTLAQWTGNVAHNTDGTLVVDLSAVFTMSNTNLSGGSISKSFKCTTIPRTSDMTLSATSVNPASTLKATINSASAKFTHKIIWSIGSKKASADVAAGVSEYTMSIPVGWMTQVTNSTKGTLKVSLKTYSGGVLVGTIDKTVSFVIPKKTEYLPGFNIALERLDNGVPETFKEYVKGVSQVKVSVSDTDYKYGATYRSVSITVCGVTKRKNASLFDLTSSGDVVISVSLCDSRGFVTKKSTTVSVCDYERPSVNIRSVKRCNSDGTLNAHGKYLVIDYKLGYSSINKKNSCEAVLKFKAAKSGSFGSSVALTGTPFVFGGGNIEEALSYVVAVGVRDSVSKTYRDYLRSVTAGAIPLNIRPGGKGAAFGKFAEKDNELGIAWNTSILGNLSVGGILNTNSVTLTPGQSVQNLLHNSRYYPALKMVWIGLRMETTAELAPNISHTVATVSCDAPQYFSPLHSVVHFSSGAESECGIQNTGEIVLRTGEAVAPGTQVYISGIYVI